MSSLFCALLYSWCIILCHRQTHTNTTLHAVDTGMGYWAALVSESMHISYRLGRQEAWICMEFVCASASAISWTREDGQHCDPPFDPVFSPLSALLALHRARF